MTEKYRKQLKYWLKTGVLDSFTFAKTDVGTPQGGVISPLLANIALHGMKFHLRKFVEQFNMTYATGATIRPSRRAQTLGLVRYADDFVVIHHDKNILLACYAEIKRWLTTMGLVISAAKEQTRLCLMSYFGPPFFWGHGA